MPSSALVASPFREVSDREPCPICGHGSWCRFITNQPLVICQRVSDGAKKERADRRGDAYWIHVLPDVPAAARHDGPVADLDPSSTKNFGLGPIERDTGYRAVLARLSLSDAHRAALRARGLTDALIDEAGYRTVTGLELPELARSARESLGESVVSGLPGYYYDRGSKQHLMHAAAGLAIPVRSLGGLVVGISIRRDTGAEKGGRRYTWVSAKFRGGASVGAPSHFSLTIGPRGEPTGTLVRITEGALKADVAAALSGVPTVGCAGLSVGPALELLRGFGVFKAVRLAFDMDAEVNPHVARAVAHAFKQLVRAHYVVEVETWDLARAKGIDDALRAGVPVKVCRGVEARSYIRKLDRVARAGTNLKKNQGGAGRLWERAENYLDRDERGGMRQKSRRSDNKLFANSMLDASYCGSIEQQSWCDKENALVMVSGVSANRPRLCAHCNKAYYEPVGTHAETCWPERVAVVRVEVPGRESSAGPYPEADPSEMKKLRKRIKSYWRRVRARSSPSRFIFSLDHILILSTEAGLDRIKMAVGALGLAERMTFCAVVPRQVAIWDHAIYSLALVGIQHRLWIAQDNWTALENSPWLTRIEHQTSANKEGQIVFKILTAAEVSFMMSRKRGKNDKPSHLCPNDGCDGHLRTDLVSMATGKRIHAWIGGPISNKDALKIAKERGDGIGTDPDAEEPICDEAGVLVFENDTA